MDLKQSLHDVLKRWDLLEHPFYQAWRAGTLPEAALRLYAREYGAFIGLLPQAWGQLGEATTAEEEREHLELWQGFARALGTEVADPEVPEVRGLLDTVRRALAAPETTLGALYAFEAQQPATAASKLEGLRLHYALSEEAEPYFEVHAANHHEAEDLLRSMEALDPAAQAGALEACEATARALWDALTGIQAAAAVA